MLCQVRSRKLPKMFLEKTFLIIFVQKKDANLVVKSTVRRKTLIREGTSGETKNKISVYLYSKSAMFHSKRKIKKPRQQLFKIAATDRNISFMHFHLCKRYIISKSHVLCKSENLCKCFSLYELLKFLYQNDFFRFDCPTNTYRFEPKEYLTSLTMIGSMQVLLVLLFGKRSCKFFDMTFPYKQETNPNPRDDL